MAYGKIVVGTDGSETALVAERVAARLARLSQGQLVLVSAYADAGGREAAERVVEEAAGRAGKVGVQAVPRAIEGEPAAAIVEFADSEEGELVVVGDVGMGQARRLRLGGVPDRISHEAPCDLLIVRTEKAVAGDPNAVPGTYESVLIATDGSPTANHAAQVGAELAVMVGAGVTLVHVGDELLGRIVLRDTAERLGDPDLPIRMLTGSPGRAIAELAAADGHDLVVVGNRGMSGARRVLGSVPNSVSHEATCDVLIVQTVGRTLSDLGPGEGAIVREGGRKVAAYRDESGELTALSPKCKHLGCTVGWNQGARTWDCPCHGSRYDAYGKVIQGPAQQDLDPIGH